MLNEERFDKDEELNERDEEEELDDEAIIKDLRQIGMPLQIEEMLFLLETFRSLVVKGNQATQEDEALLDEIEVWVERVGMCFVEADGTWYLDSLNCALCGQGLSHPWLQGGKDRAVYCSEHTQGEIDAYEAAEQEKKKERAPTHAPVELAAPARKTRTKNRRAGSKYLKVCPTRTYPALLLKIGPDASG